MEFRSLHADEIECRISQVKRWGVQLVLYKNARVDMNILDETVGSKNWDREHYECKGILFCRVGIRENETEPWVYKSDCGAESNMEAQKGESSDSFKRACVNWGIGRELYTSPDIRIKSDCVTLRETSRKDKYGEPIFTTKDQFEVEKIQIKNGRITGLAIKNITLGKRAFLWLSQNDAASN